MASPSLNIKNLTVLPLSLGLMLYPSLKYRVLLDGAVINYYGFPIPWNSDSLITSMAKDIYLTPLTIDLIFYFSIGYFLWKFANKKLPQLPLFLNRLFITIIWLYGAFALFMMVALATVEPASSIQIWPDREIFEIESVGLGSL